MTRTETKVARAIIDIANELMRELEAAPPKIADKEAVWLKDQEG